MVPSKSEILEDSLDRVLKSYRNTGLRTAEDIKGLLKCSPSSFAMCHPDYMVTFICHSLEMNTATHRTQA